MPDDAARVLDVLERRTPLLCVECLGKATSIPLDALRVATTSLVATGRVVELPEVACPVCRRLGGTLRARRLD